MVAARLALVSVALAGAAIAAPVNVEERQVTCYSGLYIIVARGSNESPGEGTPGSVADLVEASIPGSGSVATDYPATITGPLYPDSVTEGIDDTIAKIQAYVDTCGAASRIALVGYSQGGNVMTNVLAGGVNKPDPITPAYAQYSTSISFDGLNMDINDAIVTAVTVFGDPTYSEGQSFNVGTSTSDGVS